MKATPLLPHGPMERLQGDMGLLEGSSDFFRSTRRILPHQRRHVGTRACQPDQESGGRRPPRRCNGFPNGGPTPSTTYTQRPDTNGTCWGRRGSEPHSGGRECLACHSGPRRIFRRSMGRRLYLTDREGAVCVVECWIFSNSMLFKGTCHGH